MHVIRAGLAAREGDADAYAWPDRHAVYMRRGLASLVVVEATVPRARVMHGPSPGGVRHDCRVGVMRRCALRNELDDELAVRLRERPRVCMLGVHVGAVGRPARGRIELSYVRPLLLSPLTVTDRRAPVAGARGRGPARAEPARSEDALVRARDRPNGQGQTMRDDARS